jgi:flagellar motor switch protein FliN
MKPATQNILKKVKATHTQIFNQLFKCKRQLEFDLGEEKYSVNFTFFEKKIESPISIIVCINDRFFYSLTLENEFIRKMFGDYCSLNEVLQLPEYIRNIAFEVEIERFLDRFDQYCNCKSDIVEFFEEKESKNEKICIQFNLLREKDRACFSGSIKTNHEGMDWFLDKFNGLPKVFERKFDKIPLNVDFELGYALLTIGELGGVELNDILLMDERLSPKRSYVIVNIGRSLIFDGQVDPAGKIVLDTKTIQRPDEDMQKEENRHSHHAEALIGDIPVKLTFKVGETQMTFAELIDLQPGYIFEMDNDLEKPVEIKANGKSVGKGELVKIGDRLGVRVLEFEYEKNLKKR